jgi:hypothetical protein
MHVGPIGMLAGFWSVCGSFWLHQVPGKVHVALAVDTSVHVLAVGVATQVSPHKAVAVLATMHHVLNTQPAQVCDTPE